MKIPMLVSGELRVTSDLVSDHVTVTQGGILYLEGAITGDLLIEQGGTAVIMGAVHGNVINRGQLEVFGAIGGSLDSRGGSTKTCPGATIGGVPQ